MSKKANCSIKFKDVLVDKYARNIDYQPLRLGTLLPASICHLSLISDLTDSHTTLLNVMFKQFASSKDLQLPDLKKLVLFSPVGDKLDGFYREWYEGSTPHLRLASPESARDRVETLQADLIKASTGWPKTLEVGERWEEEGEIRRFVYRAPRDREFI